MKIDWFGSGGLTGDYAGVDGDIHVRIPLIQRLSQLGHQVNWVGFEYKEDTITNPWLDVLKLDKEKYCHSISDVVSYDRLGQADLLFYELRPHPNSNEKISERLLSEFVRMEELFDIYIRSGKKIVVRVTDDWMGTIAKYLDYEKMFFLTPFRGQTTIKVPDDRRRYFPYFWNQRYFHQDYASRLDRPFSFMYIGNEWGRREMMGKILDKLSGTPAGLSGNWLRPQTRDFSLGYNVCWIGKTPHWSTMPLLNKGQATFHIGHPSHIKMDFVSLRPIESYMAATPCFIFNEFPCADLYAPKELQFGTPDELVDKAKCLGDEYINKQLILLNEFSISNALQQLLACFND